ncbi:MAG: hypothetical protein ACKOCN_03025, partial [Planctomycetaceae bacterium]
IGYRDSPAPHPSGPRGITATASLLGGTAGLNLVSGFVVGSRNRAIVISPLATSLPATGLTGTTVAFERLLGAIHDRSRLGRGGST